MVQKVRFIYVWRLVKEKWFDLILHMCEQVAQDSTLQSFIHLDIFGAGDLQWELETKLGAWAFVTYHGHQAKEQVIETRRACHYTLMPSKFLETFGLSAVDSLSLGVPVIWPNKGGLGQFIKTQDLRLKTQEGLYAKVKKVVAWFDMREWEEISKQCKELAQQYTKDKRLERFQTLSWLEPGARILLVSDYIVDVGGIESYILSVQQLLAEAWYEVFLIGCPDERKARDRFRQLFGTIRNMKAQKLLTKTLQTFRPDLIWRHSIQRRRGPLPLRSAKPGRGRQWIMYHDFGLFHPYPSKVENDKQVSQATTFGGYFREWIRIHRWQFPLQLAKWVSSLLIKRHLEYIIDVHLVPSSYMEELVQEHYTKNISIKTFSHFI